MDKLVKQTRVLLCFSALSLIGFCIAAFSVDTVFIGIGLIVIGVLFAFAAIIPATKLIQMKSKQNDEKIKRLEEEVEKLKTK